MSAPRSRSRRPPRTRPRVGGGVPAALFFLSFLGPSCTREEGDPAPDPVQEAPEGPPPVGSPSVLVRPALQDLGVVGRDDVVWTSFEVVNQSAQPTRILRVAGSCGCLGFWYERVPIPPGATQELRVKLTASERAGQRLSVEIQMDAPGRPIHEVELRCFARPDPVLLPSTVSFGLRPVGNDGVVEAILSYPVPVDLEPGPESVTVLEEGPVRCVPGEPARRGVAGSIQVEVPLTFHLDASRPGPVRGRFLVRSTLHEPMEISVQGRIHPGYYLEPDRLNLGRCRVGQTVHKTVRLMFTGTTPPAVTVEGSAPWIVATALPAEAAFVPVELEVTPPQAGSFAEGLRVRVDDRDTLELPLQGLVRQ